MYLNCKACFPVVMNLSRYNWPCKVRSNRDMDPNLPWTSLNNPLVLTEMSTFDMLALATSRSGRTRTRVKERTVMLVSEFSLAAICTQIRQMY